MKKFKLIALSLSLIPAFAFFGCSPDNSAEKSTGKIGQETIENNVTNGVQDEELEIETTTPEESEQETIENNVTNGVQDEELKTETTTPEESEETTPPLQTDKEETVLPKPEVIGYKDVGDDYKRVMQPVYNALQTILDDLTEREIVALPDETAQITSLRYIRAESLIIYCSYFATIKETGERSEFLKKTVGVEIENFNQAYDDYLTYRNLLEIERKYEMNDKYVEKVLPLATEFAENLIEHYQTNKESFDVKLSYRANEIMLTANSSLSEIHAAVINNINGALSKIKNGSFPPVTNHDISITFGGNIYDEFIYSRMSITVNFQNFKYNFYNIPFNDGNFGNDYMSYFNGEHSAGYVTPFDPVPTNSEYVEFFNTLGIVDTELPLEYVYGADSFFTAYTSEDTCLNFN